MRCAEGAGLQHTVEGPSLWIVNLLSRMRSRSISISLNVKDEHA